MKVPQERDSYRHLTDDQRAAGTPRSILRKEKRKDGFKQSERQSFTEKSVDLCLALKSVTMPCDHECEGEFEIKWLRHQLKKETIGIVKVFKGVENAEVVPVPIEFFSHFGFDNVTDAPREKGSQLFLFDTSQDHDDEEYI